ncbi:MAG: TRAP transporter substrate-binding protein DctP [Thermodesulfobacteriota bacterium]
MSKPRPCLLLVVCLGLICAGIAQAQETTLKGVCFLPKNNALASQTIVWVDQINKELKGKLQINYVGGPEAIPGLQLAEAVRNGVVDVGFAPTAYYQNILPEGVAFTLSKLSPAEERKAGGFYDWMVKAHEKINSMYLGRWLWSPFYLWTKPEVKSIDNLKGLKMRTAALYDRFMKALGMAPVTIASPDTYTALERGTVDGFGWPLLGAREQGWTRVVKNVVDHPFYNQNCTILVNLDKWKTIPADVQKKMAAITAAFEPKMVDHFKKLNEDEWKELEKGGVKRIKFAAAEAKKYLDLAYQVEWDELAKKVPDQIKQLKTITGN